MATGNELATSCKLSNSKLSSLPSRYVVERLIGLGGMAEVYRAYDTELHRTVAIKILADDLATSAEGIQRFFREAQALASLNHPNILRIHGFGLAQETTRPYQVSDYLEGETLASRLQQRGPLSPNQFVSIFTSIIDALIVSSANGIVHRDIKPENVFLVTEGEIVTPILLDFGIAAIVRENQSVTLTATNTLLGSPRYMSPEQCRGTKGITIQSDIYSLACVMYECIVGECPFNGDSAFEIMSKHISGAIPSVHGCLNGQPGQLALSKFIERCLQKDPHLRPASPTEMMNEFREATQELSDSIAFQTSPAKVKRSTAISKVLMPVCTVLLLFVCVIISASFYKSWSELEAEAVVKSTDSDVFGKVEKAIHQVKRAKEQFEHSGRKSRLGDVLLKRMAQLSSLYRKEGEYGEALAQTSQMCTLARQLHKNNAFIVELQLDMFDIYSQLAPLAHNAEDARKCKQKAKQALRDANELVGSDAIGSVLVALYKSIDLSEDGKIAEALKEFKSFGPTYERIGYSEILNVLTTQEKADWRIVRFRDALTHFCSIKCKSSNDAMNLCEMITSVSNYLDALHDSRSAVKGRHAALSILNTWFREQPTSKTMKQRYQEELKQALKPPSQSSGRDVAAFLHSVEKDNSQLAATNRKRR